MRNPAAVAFTAMAVLFMHVEFVGQVPPAVAPLTAGRTVILGRVVEAGSTTGVAGSLVTLSGPALGTATALFNNGVPGGQRRVIADGQGQFAFRDLPPGAYRITTAMAGFVDGEYGQTRISPTPSVPGVSRLVEITDADRVVQVSIPMWRKAGISGRVVDEAGEPITNTPVSVLARFTSAGQAVSRVSAELLTDDRGMYHADVTPGDYIVGVLAATTTIPSALVQGFVQAQSEGATAFQAYMSQVSSLGLLPRGYGSRVGSFVVSQFGNRNAPLVPPMTYRDGTSWFYPTTYHPSSQQSTGATIVTVGPGEERAGIDLQLRAVPARTISGTVAGPSGPAAGIALRLLSSDQSLWSSGVTQSWTEIDVPQAAADGIGRFTFIGVPSGSYTLLVVRRPGPGDDSVLWAAQPIVVGIDDVSDVSIVLKPGARIGGRVVFEGEAPPPEQLRQVVVILRAVPGSGSGSAASVVGLGDATTDGTGRIVSTPYLPGPYVVRASAPGWMLKSATVSGQNAADVAFQLTDGGVDDMVVTFTKQVSIVAGAVRDESGQPGTRATIVAFPADRTLWPLPGISSRRVQTATPGRDGRFMMRGLPAGEYWLVAADWSAADFSDTAALQRLMPFATRTVIGEGQSVTQDLRVTVVR